MDTVMIGATPVELSYIMDDVEVVPAKYSITFKPAEANEAYVYYSYDDREQAQDKYLDILWHPEDYAISHFRMLGREVYQLTKIKNKARSLNVIRRQA